MPTPNASLSAEEALVMALDDMDPCDLVSATGLPEADVDRIFETLRRLRSPASAPLTPTKEPAAGKKPTPAELLAASVTSVTTSTVMKGVYNGHPFTITRDASGGTTLSGRMDFVTAMDDATIAEAFRLQGG